MSHHEKKVIQSEKAPKPVGPYSIATIGGPFVFSAGQVGLDPETGSIVPGGVEAETRQVLMNIKEVLASSNSCLENAMKTTVYLTKMDDFAKMNAVYAEFFPSNPPARTTVAVSDLPKNAMVEIDLIAMICQDGNCC